METGIGTPSLNGMGRTGRNWDLNDWNWDGNLFLATPLKGAHSDCMNKQIIPVSTNGGLSNSTSSCSGDAVAVAGINDKGKDLLEKRLRVVVVEEDGPSEEANSLTLKLGKHVYPIMEGPEFANGDVSNNKRCKVQMGNSNRGACQVEGCGADLSDAKDYHRRHKVCEMHAKANSAIVGNVVQRFCQQCSRFHLLQEFDEGKRSCRRRLAGHNKRRRKTHPDTFVSETSLTDDKTSSYLLISILRILSNMQPNNTEQPKDQDLLYHFLKNLASLAGSFDARSLSSLLQASQDQQKIGKPAGTSSEAVQALNSNCLAAHDSTRHLSINGTSDSSMMPANGAMHATASAMEMPQKNNIAQCSLESSVPRADSTVERSGLKNFDLNDAYIDGENGMDEPVQAENLMNLGTGSPNCPSWLLPESHRSSPPQTSGNSNSASADSRVSSNGDGQSQTGRIVFKLFGKDPNDFPPELRKQIFNWLDNTPTDIESYIRPGCIILTIYLRLPESTWKELCSSLSSSLRRLLDLACNDFWSSGWVYIRLQHQMAFIYNGQPVLDAPLLPDRHNHCKILSVSPIAVSISRRVDFKVKGYNLVGSTLRLLCALDGNYIAQEATHALVDGTDTANFDQPQCLSFSCSVPSISGRGFVEVEDHGLSSTFFPFIVAETEICTEICTLESMIDIACSQKTFEDGSAEVDARALALDFLHEMGWLLRRCQLMSKADVDSCSNAFPLARFKWLMEFAMEHDWTNVVKKLLDIITGGFVNVGDGSAELILSEMALLHLAVRKNSRALVELLLRYIPDKYLGQTGSRKPQVEKVQERFLFRPDTLGPYDVTPLHIAAGKDDAKDVLDALTNDPGQVGVTAWKTIHDSTGFTPEDYARSRGYKSYLLLVERKMNEKSGSRHVVLDIKTGEPGSSNQKGFEIDAMRSTEVRQSHCKVCSQQQLAYINRNASSLLYRPAMLAMVGIATVCVCVGLLLKGPPEVLFVFPPFRWELLDYGSM